MISAALREPETFPIAGVLEERAAQTRLTCLLMDDSLFDRQVIRRLVKESRFEVKLIEATNLSETRVLLSASNPDIVLLDYRVPDGDGIDLAQEICEQPNTAHPSVIVVTGEGDEGSAVRAIRCGAADYLCKDALNIDKLDHAFERALATRDRPAPSVAQSTSIHDALVRAAGRIQRIRNAIRSLQGITDRQAAGGEAALIGSGSRVTHDPVIMAARTAQQLIDDALIDTLCEANIETAGRCDLREELSHLVGASPELRRSVTILSAAHLPVIAGEPAVISLLVGEILNEGVAGTPPGTLPEVLVGSLPGRFGEPVLIIDVPTYSANARQQGLAAKARQDGKVRHPGIVFAKRLAGIIGADLGFAATPQGASRTIIRFAGSRPFAAPIAAPIAALTADSTGRRNTFDHILFEQLVECFRGRSPSERFAWPRIQGMGNGVQLFIAMLT